MTKRIVGWILLVIAGLNFLSVFVRLAQGESIGSPLYLILLVMMMVGGMSLVQSRKRGDSDSKAVVKTSD